MAAGQRIQAEREAKDWSQGRLAEAITRLGRKVHQTTIDKIEKRDSARPQCAPEAAKALGVTLQWLLDGKGPKHATIKPSSRVVGYVGAGAEAHYYANADDPDETVDMPPGGTDDTVAVEIRGTSLGTMFDRWLVYYDEVRTPPTEGMIRRLCVVGLPDGRVLVKKIIPGSKPGLFHLESQTEGIIEDQRIEWAAVVRALTPRG